MQDKYRVLNDPDKPGISGWEFETFDEAHEYFVQCQSNIYEYVVLQKVVTLEEFHNPRHDPRAEAKQRVAEMRAKRLEGLKQ